MSNSKVKLAFIGVGGMGQIAHLRNYALDPGVEVVALAELRPQLAKRVADRYGIPRIYADHRELLATEQELDGIVAIQPFQAHARLVPQLLERGLPTLIEKPLALSAEAGQRVLAAVERTGTPLYVAYHKRSDPATIFAMSTMTEWRENGAYGRLKYVRLTMPPGPWPSPPVGFDALIQSNEPAPPAPSDEHGTGLDTAALQRLAAFTNYYIHQVNLLRHLLGEDYRVTYADPASVLLAVNSTSGVSGAIEMAPYRSDTQWQEQVFIAFEKAWIRVDLPGPLAVDTAGRVMIFMDGRHGAPPQMMSPCLPPIHAMRQQAQFFVAAIRGETTPLCTAEEAIKDLRTAREYLDMLLAAEGKASMR